MLACFIYLLITNNLFAMLVINLGFTLNTHNLFIWRLLEYDLCDLYVYFLRNLHCTNMRLSFSCFCSKCDQIRSFLRICLHLLKKFLKEDLSFCALLIFVAKLDAYIHIHMECFYVYIYEIIQMIIHSVCTRTEMKVNETLTWHSECHMKVLCAFY